MRKSIILSDNFTELLIKKLPQLALQYKRGATKHEHVFSSLCS